MVFIGCHSGLDSSRVVVVVIIQKSKKHLGKKESAKRKINERRNYSKEVRMKHV